MRTVRLVPVAWMLLCGSIPGAQAILRQETLGTGVIDIAKSRLDLEVRNTYEVDPADLDGDGDFELVYCHFYLFNPPFTVPQARFTAVRGTGGIRLLYNKTAGPGGLPETCPGPPFPTPDGDPGLRYRYMRGSLVDETATRVIWTPGGTPPSVRDAEIADLDGDEDPDLVLAASVAVDPNRVRIFWPRVSEHIAQDRILLQQRNGVFCDRTFGDDGLVGGSGANHDRLPLRASNTCGVAVGDVDRDGFPDIAFAEYGPAFTGDRNILLLNDGAGHFAEPASGNPFTTSRASVDVELADLDSSGTLDIVFANANPLRTPVMSTTTWTFDPFAANRHRDEIWKNDTAVGGALVLRYIQPPDPLGLPQRNAPDRPYGHPGFWNDTRSVCIGDVDRDGDKDILFANTGWDLDEPDELSNVVEWGTVHEYSSEHHGQVTQLLLNMGGKQDENGAVPGMTLMDFLDVGHYALPWGRSTHMRARNPDRSTSRNPDGGIRVITDLELSPGVVGGEARDIGSPASLMKPDHDGSPAIRDGYPDLLVARGHRAPSTVYINSGDWHMEMTMIAGSPFWYTAGRFFRGDVRLLSDWAAPAPTDPPSPPFSRNIWTQQARIPITNRYARFDLWEASRMYATDADWVDLDLDGWLDIALANGEPTHGQINGVHLWRGMESGFRWSGPSDEGALLPYVNTVLAYGVDAGDIDADGDVDIAVAGVPTALLLRNKGPDQPGSPALEGSFEEHTFQDEGGGWLPYTGHAPLYAPLLTETVALFDAEGNRGPLEMLFGGYPPYDSRGAPYHFQNEAVHWHLYDTTHHDPVADAPPQTNQPLQPPCTFYAGVDASGIYRDRTRAIDARTGIPWLDRNGRVLENISDEIRAADLDNDGDQDLVAVYRYFRKDVHPDPYYLEPACIYDSPFDARAGAQRFYDPRKHQVTLSLWMNDGAGHLRDEAVPRLGEAWECDGSGTANYLWDATSADRYEGLAFADVDSDGDLDMLASSTRDSLAQPPRNRLFINMGGKQKNAGGLPHRTGQFRVAGLPGGPLWPWGGTVDPPPTGSTDWGTLELESADFNHDDEPDFAAAGIHPHDQFLEGGGMSGFLLMNAGDGVFVSTDFATLASPVGTGIPIDGWINHPPGGWDAAFSLEPGDFDADGDMDAVLLCNEGDVPRFFQNVSTDPFQAVFQDRTSLGSASSEGSGAEDLISWIPGWANDGVADDFDGDGRLDLYVANHDRTSQDELLLSTLPPPEGPTITSVLPESGQTTGRVLAIRGVNLAGVDTVWFEKGATSVAVPVPDAGPGSAVTPREVRVTVPPAARLGLGRVYVGTRSMRSKPFQYTHLDAAPFATSPSLPGRVGFRAVDLDGVGDLDPTTITIRRKRAGAITTWQYPSYDPWMLSATALELLVTAPGAIGQAGDVFTFEIGDDSGAYGGVWKNL